MISAQADCPEGVDKLVCDDEICDNQVCGFHGEAACFIDNCGSCEKVFLDLDNNKVSSLLF